MGRYVQAPGAVLRLCDDLRGLDSLYVMGGGRALAKALPLGAVGFGWVLPAAVGLLAGMLLRSTPHEP